MSKIEKEDVAGEKRAANKEDERMNLLLLLFFGQINASFNNAYWSKLIPTTSYLATLLFLLLF